MPVGLKEMIQDALGSVERISAQAAREELESGNAALVVDVREPHEWSKEHLPGAVNVPRGMLELRADPDSPVADPALSADKDARVIVYCTKDPGARSLLAAQTLGKMGYSNVAMLGGGLDGWRAEGLPAE